MRRPLHDQPEFITNDPRCDPTHDVGWDPDMQTDRYDAWFTGIDLAGKRVVDLGCAGAAVGAYCLSRGAASYHGIEISEEISAMARANLSMHWPDHDWTVTTAAAERVMDGLGRYDIAVAAGVMHGITDMLGFMSRLAVLADEIVFECFHPNMTVVPAMMDRLMQLAPTRQEKAEVARIAAWMEYEQPYIEINPNGKMVVDDKHATANNILKLAPSMGALNVIMHRLGFTGSDAGYQTMRVVHPRYFGRGRRFCLSFRKTHDPIPMSFADLRDGGMLETISWSRLGNDRQGA